MLLSDFVDFLINKEDLGEEDDNHVDIHLDLDKLKGAQNLESELDNKTLLALALVLLKQVQPFVVDLEQHELRF